MLREDTDTLTELDIASRATWADTFRDSDRMGVLIQLGLDNPLNQYPGRQGTSSPPGSGTLGPVQAAASTTFPFCTVTAT